MHHMKCQSMDKKQETNLNIFTHTSGQKESFISLTDEERLLALILHTEHIYTTYMIRCNH